MQYDSLPEWTDLMYKVDANEPLDPVEQFIYDEEPAGDEDGVWRAKLQAALYFFGGAPQDKGSAGLHPTTKQAQNAGRALLKRCTKFAPP